MLMLMAVTMAAPRLAIPPVAQYGRGMPMKRGMLRTLGYTKVSKRKMTKATIHPVLFSSNQMRHHFFCDGDPWSAWGGGGGGGGPCGG